MKEFNLSKLNTNHGYRAFDKEIDACMRWVTPNAINVCGYPAGMVRDRLMQRIVEVCLVPYISTINEARKFGNESLPRPDTKINCGHVTLEVGAGRLTVSLRQLISNLIEFITQWMYVATAICFLRRQQANVGPSVLVFGVGEESLFVGTSDERFIKYCRFGPITPLNKGTRFFIQSGSENTSTQPEIFSYSLRPLLTLLQQTQETLLQRARLLSRHLRTLFAYLLAVFRAPLLSAIGKDFAYSSVARSLDQQGYIESLIITTSDYKSQPLWMRELCQQKVHMVSYSQNWKPIFYFEDGVESDVPNLRWISVDTHWVWTSVFGEYFRYLGHKGETKVVGPVVWYLPEMETPVTNRIDIAIFDVPALTDEVMLSVGELTNYYHPDNLSAFINDIVSLKPRIEDVLELPVRFRLKTKRGYSTSIYERGYYDQIEKLGALGVLSFEHFSTNMYSLVSGSHLVIAYPYTSPVGIADALNVPSIYYDPTGCIVEHTFLDEQSLNRFANSPERLMDIVVSELRKSLNRAKSIDC